MSVTTAPGHELDRISLNLSRGRREEDAPCRVDVQHSDPVQHGFDYASQIPGGLIEDPARRLDPFLGN